MESSEDLRREREREKGFSTRREVIVKKKYDDDGESSRIKITLCSIAVSRDKGEDESFHSKNSS